MKFAFALAIVLAVCVAAASAEEAEFLQLNQQAGFIDVLKKQWAKAAALKAQQDAENRAAGERMANNLRNQQQTNAANQASQYAAAMASAQAANARFAAERQAQIDIQNQARANALKNALEARERKIAEDEAKHQQALEARRKAAARLAAQDAAYAQAKAEREARGRARAEQFLAENTEKQEAMRAAANRQIDHVRATLTNQDEALANYKQFLADAGKAVAQKAQDDRNNALEMERQRQAQIRSVAESRQARWLAEDAAHKQRTADLAAKSHAAAAARRAATLANNEAMAQQNHATGCRLLAAWGISSGC
jgi:colicin import membrane protein